MGGIRTGIFSEYADCVAADFYWDDVNNSNMLNLLVTEICPWKTWGIRGMEQLYLDHIGNLSTLTVLYKDVSSKVTGKKS